MVEHTELAEVWEDVERPGYFGRSRDMKIAQYASMYGSNNWRLVWKILAGSPTHSHVLDFVGACKTFYEESYFVYLSGRPDLVDWICSYAECYDNAVTNVRSGLDYAVQESYSTHIQDIAVRNVLARLGRKFDENAKILLQIRGRESDGEQLNPGNVPFKDSSAIIAPSLAPTWAKRGSVEDFWQSNKFLQRRVTP